MRAVSLFSLFHGSSSTRCSHSQHFEPNVFGVCIRLLLAYVSFFAHFFCFLLIDGRTTECDCNDNINLIFTIVTQMHFSCIDGMKCCCFSTHAILSRGKQLKSKFSYESNSVVRKLILKICHILLGNSLIQVNFLSTFPFTFGSGFPLAFYSCSYTSY